MGAIDTIRDRRARLSQILDLWDDLVDPRVGIIRQVEELPVDDDEPNFFHYLSTSCDTSPFTALKNFGNNGGVSTDRYVAIAKAMGEAVERYCSAIFRYDELLVSPYRDLDRPAASPTSFALYSDDQYADPAFPWKPVDESTPIAWTTGRSLVTGDDVLLPAAAVYVPYHFLMSAGELPFVQPISTGLAAGSSFADAALSGACEVIERDAFTITWQASMARPRIALDQLPDEVRDLIDRYETVGLRVELVDITSDMGVPTVLSFVLGTTDTSPALAVAASTAPSPTVAAIKSLEELAHTRKFARQLLDFTPPVETRVAEGFDAVGDQRDHLRLYCEQYAIDFASFAWSSTETTTLDALPAIPDGSAEEQLDAVVARIAATGLDVIACDLTTPDVAELGLSVVRVVAPGAHPLFMGHRVRSRGGHRLYEVPQRLGYPGIDRGGLDNVYPHPFP